MEKPRELEAYLKKMKAPNAASFASGQTSLLFQHMRRLYGEEMAYIHDFGDMRAELTEHLTIEIRQMQT